MTDELLKTFFEKERWIAAIEAGVEKDMDPSLLRNMSSPDARIELYHQLRDGTYHIAPPHEAQIPKDDGTFRTVYVNEGKDRIILSIINNMLFELCPEFIHPQCKSYQTGIGCGKIVKHVSHVVQHTNLPVIGVKVDLSKYFDSVPIRFIDEVFNRIQTKLGKSKILDILIEYYHMNTVLDMKKQPVEKYSSLRQGCAVAAFLADAVLCDIDTKISNDFDIYYVRYSDDILIIGKEWQSAYDQLKIMLESKELILNPKKVEYLSKERWFKFLGFCMKNDKITLSASKVKSFQKEILLRTVKAPYHSNMETVLQRVHEYLYTGNGDYSWATSVLPVINAEPDIQTLNNFVMDAIRATATGNTHIGGLGTDYSHADGIILRGKGRHVKSNRTKIPTICGYKTIKLMQNAMNTSKGAYTALLYT